MSKKNGEPAVLSPEAAAAGLGWAELADIIAGRYGIDPLSVWREYSLRQIVVIGNLAMRARYRDRAFLAALHGVKLDAEPEWNFGFNASQKRREIEELQAYIARKKAQKK